MYTLSHCHRLNKIKDIKNRLEGTNKESVVVRYLTQISRGQVA